MLFVVSLHHFSSIPWSFLCVLVGSHPLWPFPNHRRGLCRSWEIQGKQVQTAMQTWDTIQALSTQGCQCGTHQAGYWACQAWLLKTSWRLVNFTFRSPAAAPQAFWQAKQSALKIQDLKHCRSIFLCIFNNLKKAEGLLKVQLHYREGTI